MAVSKVIFEVTEDHLETGLRGILVGYCTTSSVDPEKGLFYGGIPLTEIYSLPLEEVVYLLYKGERGTPREISAFSRPARSFTRSASSSVR